jgi:hypothetical protein
MSDDMFDWEVESPLGVEVVAGIYVHGEAENGSPLITCGFIEDKDSGTLRLPSMALNTNLHAAEAAVKLFSKYLNVDLRTIDIVPYGFFDPMVVGHTDDPRIIILGYKTHIHPGTPAHKDLRFINHAEIDIATGRIKRGHRAAYLAGSI